MTTADHTPAECFSPGEYIHDEMKARGWTRIGLMKRMFPQMPLTPIETVLGLLAGDVAIDKDLAGRLARAFGTSAEFWRNLQANYDRDVKAIARREATANG